MTPKDMVSTLSIDQKIKLLSGKNFWYLNALPKYDLKSIMLTDGPHGLRKQTGTGDAVGLSDSIPSTCFPTASCLASSWDRDLLKEVGQALGEVCLKEDVSVLLGPGVNIKRHPLAGRNFEYFSEDPYLSGHLGAAMIQGIQSKGIGASVKHFVANNQESRRMTINTIIDERTLREIYLKSFEIIVKESHPGTIMSSYNQVNGEFSSENEHLLKDILRHEWGYEGVVVTDWGANNDPVKAVNNGLNLEMPGNHHSSPRQIKKALKKGRLAESTLDKALEKNIGLMVKANETLTHIKPDVIEESHHQLARKAACESMVLLKNHGDVLPLDTNQRVALIGEMAIKPRYQGSGSSLIKPTRLSNAYDAFKDILRDQMVFAKGYDLEKDDHEEALVLQAIDSAKTADLIFVMAGLPDAYESEGFDRTHLQLPTNQNILIERLSSLKKPIIISLSNGAPVQMPWIHEVDGIIEQYLAGQASGQALADLVFGRISPCGKLAETFPNHLDEILAHQNFPGQKTQVEYREGLYVGYRGYDALNIEPLFAFGHGLTYSKIEYHDFSVYNDLENHRLVIKGSLKNTGQYPVKEVVQIYISKNKSLLYRPEKELKGFSKTYVQQHSEERITLIVPYKDLYVYQDAYVLEKGAYTVYVGASSRDIRFKQDIHIFSEDKLIDDQLGAYRHIKDNQRLNDSMFKALLGKDIPRARPIKPYHLNSTMADIKTSLIGKKLYQMIEKQMQTTMNSELNQTMEQMIERIIDEMPIRSLVTYSQGKLSFRRARGLIDLMNHHPIKGLIKIILN
jgi:beta-glucosidase